MIDERIENRLKLSFKNDEKRNNDEFFESQEFKNIFKEKKRTSKERAGWPQLGKSHLHVMILVSLE